MQFNKNKNSLKEKKKTYQVVEAITPLKKKKKSYILVFIYFKVIFKNFL